MKTKTLFQFWMAVGVMSALMAADEVPDGWHNDCSTTKDWYDSKSDPGFHAKVEQAEPSVIKVAQEGGDTWGKVAYVIKEVDLDKTPVLEVKVNKVDSGSAFKVAVAPLDWSNLYVVVPRSSADGIQKGDIKAATGWTGLKDFNVVLIVEGPGKAAWFDNIRVTSIKK
jgi:hypothetical protein